MNDQANPAPPSQFDPAAEPSASYDSPINILIVDDEPKNLTVLETLLEDPGYRLVRAESADQALLALVVEEFALLILDIRMPGMNGIELAHMIKERKKTALVPIIFLTAYYNEDQHVLEGYGSGAVDYLHKPVSPAILRSKVAIFAELYRKRRECVLANRALLTEVTERRRAQEQLRDLNETLKQRVTEQTKALRGSEERMRMAIEATAVGIWEWNVLTHAIRWDAQLFRIYGIAPTPDGFVRYSDWSGAVLPEDLPESERILQDTVRRCGLGRREFRIHRRNDGEVRDIEAVETVRTNEHGQAEWVLGTNLDVTELRKAQKQLKAHAETLEKTVDARTASLRETIEQLEEFSYSVAHDLRAPLRAMQGYAEAVLMDYGDQIGEEGKDYLQRISNAALRMDRLTSDTLTYSKVAGASMPSESVSLDKLVPEIIQHYPQIEAAQAEIIVASPLLPVLGNEIWLTKAISNLLGNAVKFVPEGTTPQVRVWSESRNGDVRLWIEDNGIGIKPEH